MRQPRVAHPRRQRRNRPPHPVIFHERSSGDRRQLRRNHDAPLLQQAVQIARPPRRHGRRAKRVLQHQVPANDPRHQLAQRRVSVGVSRSGDRNDGRELGIAKSGKGARESRQHETQRHGWARVERCRLAGQHKNSRADHCANSQRDQVHGSERTLQRVLTLLARFLREH